jgi:hypothetical protein
MIFIRVLGTIVYKIDEETGMMKVAYPFDLFVRVLESFQNDA